VSSLDSLISIGLLPISFALTAPVAAALGARTTLVGVGILGAIATLAAFFLPRMRAIERSDEGLVDAALVPPAAGAAATLR
jgi:DHA3 family tetracycline resistance protein-like MFS transporter